MSELEKNADNLKDTTTLMSIHLDGYEVLEKIVRTSGNSGRVYLPLAWVGKRIKIIRIDPLDDNE